MTDNRKQIEYRRNKYNNQKKKNVNRNFQNNKNQQNKNQQNKNQKFKKFNFEEKKEEKTIGRKILEIFSSILAIIVILASLFTLVFRVIFKVEVVKLFGYSGLIVLTGSMENAYHPGDLIFIKEQNTYEVNDVITFHQKGMIVTHRIVEKNGEKYITKGDANNTSDSEIELADIEGRVIGSISKVGNFILFMQTPAGIVAILVILISLEVFFAAKRKMVEK